MFVSILFINFAFKGVKILIMCYMGFFSFLFENYVWGHKTNSLIPQNKKSDKNISSFSTFKNHMS